MAAMKSVKKETDICMQFNYLMHNILHNQITSCTIPNDTFQA